MEVRVGVILERRKLQLDAEKQVCICLKWRLAWRLRVDLFDGYGVWGFYDGGCI